MAILNVIYSSKLWLTLSLAVIMGMGTITPDIHPEEAAEVVCQETGDFVDVDSSEKPNRPSKAPHDHHAHSCGSCHFHATPIQMTTLEAGLYGQFNYDPKSYNSPSDQGPYGLFRPPRA